MVRHPRQAAEGASLLSWEATVMEHQVNQAEQDKSRIFTMRIHLIQQSIRRTKIIISSSSSVFSIHISLESLQEVGPVVVSVRV